MKVFISHIHEEERLAISLKEWIETTFTEQCRAFVSSHPEDIALGQKWLDEIDQALSEANLLLILCSPLSVSRPWINFEAGCGFNKKVPIIPICHSGQLKNELPSPLSTFQSIKLEKSSSCKELITSLAKYMNIKRLPRISFEEMFNEINK